MNQMKLKVLVIILVAVGFVVGVVSGGEGEQQPMQILTTEIIEKTSLEISRILEGRQENDIRPLKQVVAQLAALRNYEDSDIDQWPLVRKAHAGVWIQTLETVNKLVDQDFDFDDVPKINIAPSGPYPSGISPEAIKEPEIRRQYEEDIAKNEKKAQQYAFQYKVLKIQKSLSRDTENFLILAYSAPPDAFDELRKLLESHSLDQDMIARIQKQTEGGK